VRPRSARPNAPKELTVPERKSEIDRILGTYQRYHEDDRILGRWDARNEGNRAMAEERRRATRDLLEQEGYFPLAERSVLDVGCGAGSELVPLIEWGADPTRLHGVDLLPDRIEIAKARLPAIDFRVGNAETLDFADESFDIVLLFTVFSSILDSHMSDNVAREVARVVKPGGAVVWYDFRWPSPYNRSTRPVWRRRIEAYFPSFRPVLQTLTVLPPLSRRLGRFTQTLYPLLGSVPLMRSHYFGLLIKPTSNSHAR
jgi:SAM-dependent methyltransferase